MFGFSTIFDRYLKFYFKCLRLFLWKKAYICGDLWQKYSNHIRDSKRTSSEPM